ncbi:MAG: TPM domain-containing protein [Spirochaetes bacterium]|nr:TPM domain-containing protein [Spirochaetota bacterium]
MKRRRFHQALLTALAALLALAPAMAAIPVPELRGRVTDDAGVLGDATEDHIGSLLKSHEERTTNQVAVLTITSLEGESIEEFATRVFGKWRLGRKKKDNGVLIIVAVKDRRMRIEVGYGLEGVLTDVKAGRIIDTIMAPRFKAGDFDGGVTAGALAVIAQLEDKNAPLPGETGGPGAGSDDFLKGPDLPIYQRILFGCFIFGIIGLFTIIGVVVPRAPGWFLYLFLIPFWATFPIVVVGPRGAFILLCVYLAAFPAAKIIVSRRPWYKKARRDLEKKGRATIGGFTFSASSSGGGSSSGGSGGFSGGGGSSGGGGASGGW